MAKERIKLDLDSTDNLDFERDIAIPTPDGRELVIPFTCKYRDRVETGALFDSFGDTGPAPAEQPAAPRKGRKAAGQAATAPKAPTLEDGAVAAAQADADTVMKCFTGWGLEMPFTRENVVKFVTRYPGATLALLLDYRVSLTQGRLGN